MLYKFSSTECIFLYNTSTEGGVGYYPSPEFSYKVSNFLWILVLENGVWASSFHWYQKRNSSPSIDVTMTFYWCQRYRKSSFYGFLQKIDRVFKFAILKGYLLYGLRKEMNIIK